MYEPVKKIEVSIWGQRVGVVALDPKLGSYVFAYDPNFIKKRIELSPIMMPVSTQPYVFTDLPVNTYKRLPAMLADSLPDAFGNRLVEKWMARQGISPDKITSLDRLAYMGKRSMGALEFKPVRSPHVAESTAIEMARLVESTNNEINGNANTDDMTEAALMQIIQVGTSAGGARAKAVIAWNPATKEIRTGQFDVTPGFEHWLLKIDGVNDKKATLNVSNDYGRTEYVYYQMASHAGIKMYPCQLLEENGRAHFMTKRFDRDNNQKHHIQTLCALSHLDYNQIATHDYSQLFITIDRLGLDYKDKEEAYRRMVFNVMACNCDDHTKNISFILKEGGEWKLTPAYDMIYAYNPNGEINNQHLMSVNGKFKDISITDIKEVANRFSIGTANKAIEQVSESVKLWPQLAKEAGINPNKVQRIHQHHEQIRKSLLDTNNISMKKERMKRKDMER